MFERFTHEARSIVVDAQTQARRLGHRVVGTEHLLLALLATPGPASRLLGTFGITVEGTTADIVDWTGDRTEHDRRALALLGIDLDRVREAAESAFGAGALDRLPTPSRRPITSRLHRRRRPRPCDDGGRSGHLRFSPRAKKALELSLREALRLKHNYIGAEHILLGVLREGEGLACAVLVRRVPLDQLRNALQRTLRQSA